jgi:putative tryptophan/tyrosine transport system substrate-binding protein
MKRRDFITLLGGAATWPLAARAQQSAVPVVGWLNSGSAETYAERASAFRQGLGDIGYLEGRTVAIEYRWANGRYDQLPALAADLVHHQVSVIAANSPATAAARLATSTIPIVFVSGIDPVATGWVSSLARPGGNLTGISNLNAELGPKRLELLREVIPDMRTTAVLINPAGPGFEMVLNKLNAASRTLGLRIELLHATGESDFDKAFVRLAQLRAGGLVIASDPLFISWSKELAGRALHQMVPAIFQYREFAAAGGLMSYGIAGNNSQYRLQGQYAGRILKGEKAADLPVQQATQVELIINLKTAKALGIMVPITLLGRADEVIE